LANISDEVCECVRLACHIMYQLSYATYIKSSDSQYFPMTKPAEIEVVKNESASPEIAWST
jgi:hypothetical protein